MNDAPVAWAWHLENTGQAGGAPGADVNAVAAWRVTRGRADISVAIVDTGFDLGHEVFDGVPNARGIVETFGSIGDVTGSHGTASASLAVGRERREIGLCGVAPGCALIPIVVPSPCPSDVLALAIGHALERGADVIACSAGLDRRSTSFADLDAALDRAGREGRGGRGCLVVWAAGNDASPLRGDPAAEHSATLVVGASTNFDTHASYSNFGPSLDLVAPSGGGSLDVTAAVRRGLGDSSVHGSLAYTAHFGGTSAACAIVAGVAALVLCADASLTARRTRELLRATARPLGAPSAAAGNAGRGSRNDLFGHGAVDAGAAVLSARG